MAAVHYRLAQRACGATGAMTEAHAGIVTMVRRWCKVSTIEEHVISASSTAPPPQQRRHQSSAAAAAAAANGRRCGGGTSTAAENGWLAPRPRREHVHPEVTLAGKRGHKSGARATGGDTIRVTFIEKDGEEFVIEDAPVGESMLEVAHANDVELEGACEGSLACSTCHVIIEDEDLYDRLPEPTDDENDMLDLAFGLAETYVPPKKHRNPIGTLSHA